MTDQSIPIQCVIDAIPEDKRDEHQQAALAVMKSVTEVHESDEAYTLIVPIAELQRTATWITWERLCCPFLSFTLQIAPATEHLAITIGNGAEVKMLLEHELLVHVPVYQSSIGKKN